MFGNTSFNLRKIEKKLNNNTVSETVLLRILQDYVTYNEDKRYPSVNRPEFINSLVCSK